MKTVIKSTIRVQSDILYLLEEILRFSKYIEYLIFVIMVKSTPLLRKKIVKKRTLKFTRFQSDLYAGRLAPSWRRARGSYRLMQVLITE